MASKPAQGSAHLLRDRETYRYLDLSYIHGYIDNATDAIPRARPGRDSVLTSLIQLAVLRLNAQRAFVSLFDSRYQYVIAETTASSTLRRPTDTSADEGLILCGLALPHAQGVSKHVLQTALESISGDTSEEQDRWKIPVCIIPDVQADERFAASRLLSTHRDIRFYVAVPIRSQAGPLIGVLAITDSMPRMDLTALEAAFLQDMSLTVMDHLTMIRHRQEEARGKRMMRGLGSFVEGVATMSDLTTDEWFRPADESGEGVLNVAQQAKMKADTDDTNRSDISPVHTAHPTDESDFDRAPPQHSGTPTFVSGQDTSGVGETLQEPLGRPPNPTSSASNPTSLETAPIPSNERVRKLFSRAANIIRESIEVEGALFFDASVAMLGDTVGSGRRDSSDTLNSNSAYHSSSGEESVRSSQSGTFAKSKVSKNCDIFGFSTTTIASIDGDKPQASHLTVPERFLHVLLQRYPEGKIFNFDENGVPVSDTESDDDHLALTSLGNTARADQSRWYRQRSLPRNREPSFIIRIFPDARSVIAFPLWDSHRSRWYAGGVVWTRTPNRVFSVKNELSYLRAFGASIMAEIAKIDAQQADRAKADVLGSISHELRSPLHGILGGIELLQETDMDVFQGSVLHTVERCGITLLDTISHLLDYAKVNNLIRSAKERRREGVSGHVHDHHQPDRSPKVASLEVDVGTVVEEVIESVFAGHEFETSGDSKHVSQDSNMKNLDAEIHGLQGKVSPDASAQNHVRVILNIRPAENWQFSTQVGALRRMIMNVFGNALKYTTAGYVKVTVDQKPQRHCMHTSDVTIVVEDTGRGIGSEFLANHLFTPFLQEDSLSTGVGLGLSITHQIVKSLGGAIDAQSKPGRGTTISITVPLEHSAASVALDNDLLTTLVRRTQGLRVSLSGFDEPQPSAASEESASHDWFLPRATIAEQCRDWLRMEVLPPDEKVTQPDLYVATLAGAERLAGLNRAGVVIQPVLVICPTAGVARALSTAARSLDSNGVFEYIAQPCGPRKLAKTVVLALDRWAAIQIEEANAVRVTQLEDPSTSSTFDVREPDVSPGPDTAPEPGIVPPPMMSLPQRPPALSPIGTPKMYPNIAPYLVVDDNAINVKLLATFLHRQDLVVATATDGALAIAAYQAARGVFSCIFMDIQMPQLDGLAATRAIREYERREGLPAVHIVVLTGLATRENAQEAEASGANEVFSKPVRLKGLNPIIEKTRRTLGT